MTSDGNQPDELVGIDDDDAIVWFEYETGSPVTAWYWRGKCRVCSAPLALHGTAIAGVPFSASVACSHCNTTHTFSGTIEA